MHAEEIIAAFFMSNIYIGLCLPKALTLTWLRSYAMLEVLLIPRNNKRVGLQGVLSFPLARGRVSAPVGKRDSLEGGSSAASAIQGQNSTPSTLRSNSHITDNTQHVTFTPSATQPQSIYTPTAILGTSSRSTPKPGRSSQTYSTRRVVSHPSSGIASTPTPLSGLENLPTCIANPAAL